MKIDFKNEDSSSHAPSAEIQPDININTVKMTPAAEVEDTQRKKTKLLPPTKNDQPMPQKRKYVKSKTKMKIENDQKQKKITNMFKPKPPSRTVDNKTSEMNIYTEDNNFKDDLIFEDIFEDNPSNISGLSSGVCSPQPLVRQDLPGSSDIHDISIVSLISTNQQQPDLARKGLALVSSISNQQITGESGRPNDQITSENIADGSVYHKLEKDQHQNLIENVCKVIKRQ